MTARSLFLHVGCRKTGTSSLQTALRASRSELILDGLGVPLRGRPGHLRGVLRPLTALASGEEEAGRQGVRNLVEHLRSAPGDRLLVTIEDLAELPRAAAEHLVESLRPHFEIHLVITARDWTRQIPSEWQQAIKSRSTIRYADFAQAVRDAAPAAEQYWRRQYVPDIARRWGGSLPPQQVHVLAVPPARREPMGIYELFADLMGFEVGRLEITRDNWNTSLGYEQAEVLRRVNVALGDRLADVRSQYRPAVRQMIINRGLRSQGGQRLALPAEHLAWCRELCESMVADLRSAGYDLRGDPNDLLPPPDGPDAHGEPSADRIAEVAIQALAEAAVTNHTITRNHQAALAAAGMERQRLQRALKARRRAEKRAAREQPVGRARRLAAASGRLGRRAITRLRS